MSTAHPRSESWSRFWGELVERLDAIDLTSRSANKFDDLAVWLAQEFRMRPSEVVCKYVQHSKNRWNRLREASRRAPAAILLILEGDDQGELAARVSETAAVCPSLRLVVAVTRRENGPWVLATVLGRTSASMPEVLSCEGNPVQLAYFEAPDESERLAPLPPLKQAAGQGLSDALRALAIAGGEAGSPHRILAAEAFTELTAQPTDRIAFKTVPSSKNLGNRLGEAIAKSPTIFVVVCPEMLEDRVLEEVDRWSTSSAFHLVLVLCGEETRIEVHGPETELALRLRVCLGIAAGERRHVPAAETVPSKVLEKPRTGWRRWSYLEWNERLVEYTLRADRQNDEPVERLAATPEELAVMAGAAEDEVDEVARAFVDACLSNIPSGRSFHGYCGSKLGRKRASEIPWTPESTEPPYFFAMLWLTSLVAYGYPDVQGGFYERFWDLIGNKDGLHGLPELWWEVCEWTYRRNEAGASIRILSLPPKDDFRTTIGESHFLAFPHKHDRRQIARALVEADLVGFEPPIAPVISALQHERDKFSQLFREDLDNFVSHFVGGGRDPRDSAFWRAVRQEALQPSFSVGGGKSRRGSTSILGVFDDEGFLPLLGCVSTWTPPEGYRVQPLDNRIGDYEHYAVTDDGSLEGIHKIMFESIGLLGPGPRALINQGVLVFQEDQSSEFFLVSGHDISGADLALVRDDNLSAFLETFGGVAERSRINGWSEVTGCRVKPLDDPPAALQSVVQLQRTMSPPGLRFVGGIQLPGAYLGIEGFLPRVRAPGADKVYAVLDDREYECEHTGDGEWLIPSELLRSLPADLRVVGSWQYGKIGKRTSERTLHIRGATVGEEFRSLGSGHYFMESCRPGQKSVVGGEPIPLGISTDDASCSIDLLEYEPSVRFLGPGLGEMSTSRRPGYDWLAVGHKNHPELLVFTGDVGRPTAPADRRSPAAGDRRHWKAAFGKPRDVRVRSSDGTYHEIADFPEVLKMHKRMTRHNPRPDAQTCHTTGLDTVSMVPPERCDSVDSTKSVADALAALSSRRSGLHYRTVQQLFESLTGVKDYRLHHQLIRSWIESGALDLVRNQSFSSTRIVARRPRFVAARRGPLLEASLVGLVTRATEAQVCRIARECGVVSYEVQPGCPWQQAMLRVRATEMVVREIGDTAGLAPLEWLAWTEGDEAPEHLHIDVKLQELWTDDPPEGFLQTKSWDWEEAEFRRDSSLDANGVRVEQRAHRQSSSVYVVTVDGVPQVWTHVRNWALLYAHVVAGQPPFVLNRSGWITTTGRSPVNLPLPLGRLCAVLGDGTPGPLVESQTTRAETYCYPFGCRLTELIARMVPANWLKDEVA